MKSVEVVMWAAAAGILYALTATIIIAIVVLIILNRSYREAKRDG